MFDSAQSATILDGQFASIQAQTVHVTYGSTVSSEDSRTHDRQTSRATRYSPNGERDILDFDSSQVDIRKDSQIYHDLLFVKGRGSPLWTPGPTLDLALEYRRTGARIGDVGIINSDGGFSFLFIILLSADHPINRNRVPSTFQPLAVDISGDVETSHIGDDYALSNAVINTTSIADSGLIFDSHAKEGAVLTTPGGTWLSELRHRTSFRQYIEKNLESWYEYANGPRGREARNGDIRLVYGVEKVSSWGMATFSSTQQEHTRLEFKKVDPSSPQMHSTSYTWQCSGAGAGRVGPSIVEYRDLMRHDTPSEPLVNQTVFLRTLNPMLSDAIWKEKFAHTMPAEDQFEAPLRNPRPEKSTCRKERKVQVHDAILHPSDALNRYLLSSTGADMVITEDDDWPRLFEEVPPFQSPDTSHSEETALNQLRPVLAAYPSSAISKEYLLKLSEDPILCVLRLERNKHQKDEVQNVTGLSEPDIANAPVSDHTQPETRTYPTLRDTVETEPASAAFVANFPSITGHQSSPNPASRSMGESHRRAQRIDAKELKLKAQAMITAPQMVNENKNDETTAFMARYDHTRHREMTHLNPEIDKCEGWSYPSSYQPMVKDIDLGPWLIKKRPRSPDTDLRKDGISLSRSSAESSQRGVKTLADVTPTTQHHSAASHLISQADSGPPSLRNLDGAYPLGFEPESYLVHRAHPYQDASFDVPFLPLQELTFPSPPLSPIPGPFPPASYALFYDPLRCLDNVDDAERPIKVWNPSIVEETLKINGRTYLISSSVVSDGGISLCLDSSGPSVFDRCRAREFPEDKFVVTPDTTIRKHIGSPFFTDPFSSHHDGTRTPLEASDTRDVRLSDDSRNPTYLGSYLSERMDSQSREEPAVLWGEKSRPTILTTGFSSGADFNGSSPLDWDLQRRPVEDEIEKRWDPTKDTQFNHVGSLGTTSPGPSTKNRRRGPLEWMDDWNLSRTSRPETIPNQIGSPFFNNPFPSHHDGTRTRVEANERRDFRLSDDGNLRYWPLSMTGQSLEELPVFGGDGRQTSVEENDRRDARHSNDARHHTNSRSSPVRSSNARISFLNDRIVVAWDSTPGASGQLQERWGHTIQSAVRWRDTFDSSPNTGDTLTTNGRFVELDDDVSIDPGPVVEASSGAWIRNVWEWELD